MTYRLIITSLFVAGLLAGLVLGVFYFIVDRGPSTWNRAARIITGLITVIMLSYASGTLQLLGGAIPDPPTNVIGWTGFTARIIAVPLLWYLVYVYLTPHRRNGSPPELGTKESSAEE